jgi:3-phosphoshikimate 1-carboxyvinyltransferase
MNIRGTLRVPGDKSCSHRALMLAALGTGASRVRGVLDSADVRSTAGVLRALGVDVPALAPDIVVPGVGLHGLRASDGALDCGNSGTSTRLLAGIAAACPFDSTFVGDASLSKRPMKRIARPLEAMGARFEFEHGDGLPMTIHGGALHAIEWTSETASAQVKSAILLAGLVGAVSVTVREPSVSRDHTERMLAARGVRIDRAGTAVTLEPAASLHALDAAVPADPSSAAFPAALAALAASADLLLTGVCLNPTRAGFFHVLRRMGADVEFLRVHDEGGESVGDIHVGPTTPAGRLLPVTIGADEIPTLIDEIPLIACIAARADGETVITGASELRVKESDRIAVVVDNLRSIGAVAEELPDGMRIVGTGHPLRGTVETHLDHRIAMAFGVLAALPGNDLEIDHRECVDVSYPAFWSDIEHLRST